MSLERLNHHPSISLARRALVQRIPESFGKSVEISPEQAHEVIAVGQGYDVDQNRITQALLDQQRELAHSLRRMGFVEAATMTEQRLGNEEARSAERPH